MIYILDTNIIRKLWFHFPKKGIVFERIWETLNKLIELGIVISVDEVYNELNSQFSSDNEAFAWISEHKYMFKNPDNEESLTIQLLFRNNKFQESIHIKNILGNRPSADAYLVAKAKKLNATIVTTETSKPNSAQLPNICEAFGVMTITYDDFMEFIQSKFEI